MGTTTDWRPLFVASAASMLRVKASKKWPGWQDAIQEDAAKAACRQAAADIEGIPALRARAEAAEQRAEALAAELAQARADRALLAGLWLITVPPRELPALLPIDQGDRDRLAAALDAVDRQTGAEARIAAGRAVIARIVAEMAGGAR